MARSKETKNSKDRAVNEDDDEDEEDSASRSNKGQVDVPVSSKQVTIDVKSRSQAKEAWLPLSSKKSAKRAWITSLEISNLSVALKYVVTDTKRHKRDWVIGLTTVFLVVLFTSMLQNAISKSPIVFLKLAEDQVGEYDLVSHINFTDY